jgi:predicted acylesterase/phospholipase RssA
MDIRMGAYDIFQKENIILSKDNFPKMKLATAATISASIPHYFGYHKIREERSGRDLYLVDGGISINYPIDQFERVEGRDLIGLWVRSGSSIRPQKRFSTLLYIKNSLTAWQEIISREHIEDAYWANTIPILIEDVSSLDFNLTQSQKDGLIKTGYDAVMRWQEYKNGRTDSK